MRQDITDLQSLYDGRYSCEENVYRGGLWDNEQEEYETGERRAEEVSRRYRQRRKRWYRRRAYGAWLTLNELWAAADYFHSISIF